MNGLSLSLATTRPMGSGAPPFTPAALSGLSAWYDATQGVTTDGATTRVASWAPAGGTAGTATQAVTAAMPLVSSMNGKASIQFDGADDSLQMASGFVSDTLTIFVVGKKDSLAFNGAYLGSTTNSSPLYYVLSSGAQRYNIQNQNTVFIGNNGKVVAGAPFLMSMTFDRNGGVSGPFACRFNRAADASGTVATSPYQFPANTLGSQGGAGYMGGLISEIVVYSRILSGAEIAQVEDYLAAKWGTA